MPAGEATGKPLPLRRPLYATGFTGSTVEERFQNMPVKRNRVGGTTTGPGLVAVNIVATRMVMGPGAPIEATPVFVQAIADMETVFTDEAGTVLQTAPASALLGNPLRVVLWLVEEFKRRGKTLQAGDRLSLGAVGKLFPLSEGGKTYTHTLNGLPSGTIATMVRVD